MRSDSCRILLLYSLWGPLAEFMCDHIALGTYQLCSGAGAVSTAHAHSRRWVKSGSPVFARISMEIGAKTGDRDFDSLALRVTAARLHTSQTHLLGPLSRI